MYTPQEISLICAALADKQGYNGMTYEELIFYVAFDNDLCNTVIHALDCDALETIHSLLN